MPGVLIFVFCAIIVVGMVVSWTVAGEKKQTKLQTWQRTAKAFGLQLTVDESDWSITGSIGEFGVAIRSTRRNRQVGTQLLLASAGIPRSLKLNNEDGWRELRKAVVGQDILTGDDEFDRRIHIQGKEVVALAVLGASARAYVRDFVLGWGGSEGVVEDGQLAFHIWAELAEPGTLSQLVKDAVGTAESLQLAKGQARARLAQNAEKDPIPGVRGRNMEVLARKAPGSNLALSCFRAGLKDANSSLRIFAAANLGEQDLPRLLELAATDGVPAVRAQVIRHLASFAGSALRPAIDRGIRALAPDLQRAAIFAAGATGYAEIAPQLAQYGDSKDPLLAQAVAEALQQLGASDAEPTLLKLLAHESVAVRTAAAQALGALGTVVAVEALLAETTGVLKDATLKRTALQAIANIQSRLGPVEMGRLSVVQPVPLEGALSTPENDETVGALSVIPDESSETARKPP